MGEVWVNGGADDLAANLPEIVGGVTEGDDLSRAHKGEVQGIEEENDVFPCTTGRENK